MRSIAPRVLSAALAATLVVGCAGLALTPAATPTDGEEPLPTSPSERIQTLIDAERSGVEGLPTIREGLADSDPDVRAAAVQMAWSLGGIGEFDRILPLVEDTAPNVVQTALLGMVAFDDPRVIAPVSAALRGAPDPIRAQLASMIGERRDTRFTEGLSALLSSDKPALRRTGLEAMRASGSPACFPFLMAATGDSDGRVVSSAISGLEALGDERARPRVTLLAASEHSVVRVAVARALPALGPAQASGDVLRTLLADSEESVRMAVVTGIRDHYDATAVPILAAAARSEDVRIRRSAAAARRGAVGDEGAEVLDRLLADGEPTVRSAAIQSTSERAIVSRLDRLIAMVEDPSAQVRTILATALGTFDDPKVGGALTTLSRDGDPSVRAAVAESAGTIPGPVGGEILERLAADGDTVVRTAAVRALGRRGDGPSLERLRRAVTDAEIPVRVAALMEIGRLGDSGSIDAVREALTDPVEAVRNTARTAMTAIRPPGSK